MTFYKWCAVPYCGSSSLRTPEKLFIRVPLEKKMRNKWLQMARRDPHLISLKTKLWFCESHFNLEEDMENYMEYKLMGAVKRIRINPKCIPCKFECLPNFWKGTFTSPPRFSKKPRITEKAIETECLADQTPTPTRFIRNCEEVGLFQDLQNVNPFDETFKKAIESGRSWHIPQEPKQTNDDTLHTPHIFPPVDAEQTVKFTNETVDVHPPNEFCFVSVPIDLSDDEYDSDQTHDLVINTSGSDNEIENNSTNIPQKSNDKQRTNGVQSNKTKQIVQSKPNNIKEKNWEDAEEREKLRAMNRAAQSRCRRRKQQQQQRMEEDLKRYKDENVELMRENQIFKYKFAALKDLIIKARNNRKVKHPILNEVERILNSVVTLQNKVPISPKTHRRNIAPITATTKLPIVNPTTTTNVPIVPATVPVRPTTVPPVASKPVLIQVVGAVDQVAVSVVPK